MESFRIPIEGSSQWLLVFLDTVFFCLFGFKKEKKQNTYWLMAKRIFSMYYSSFTLNATVENGSSESM